jgi:ribokinase
LPNKAEIEKMFGMNYMDAAEECLSLGIEVVAVKLGEKGCWIRSGNKEFTVPAYRVKAIDTTGAGDAFNAGFLYGYLTGKDIETCGKSGTTWHPFAFRK